jgi:hypothetical protein
MSDNAAVQKRWQEFRAKISARHQEIITEAGEGLAALAADDPDAPRPLTTAMTAIQMRLIALRQKLEETFSEKIVDGLQGKAYNQAKAELDSTRRTLEHDWERFRIKTLAAFVRAMLPRLDQVLHKPVPCSQCGAPLALSEVIRLAITKKCEHCGAINQVSPDKLVATFYGVGPHTLAEEATLEQRFALDEMSDRASRNSEAKKKWEEMERAYWEAYVAELCKHDPLPAEERQRYVDSRVEMWRSSHRD